MGRIWQMWGQAQWKEAASSLAEGTLQPSTLVSVSLFFHLLNSDTRADDQKCCPISKSLTMLSE